MRLLLQRAIRRVRYTIAGASGRRHKLVGSLAAWKGARVFQREFLLSQGLEPGHRLIEIGCGTLRGGLPLIEWLDTGHYTGLEVREDHLAAAHRELADSGLAHKEPALVRSEDFSTLSFEPVDYVWAYAVLIHMSDPILESCFEFVSRNLAAGGQLLATVNLGDEGQPGDWKGFPVMRHPLAFWQALATRHGLGCDDLGVLADLGDQGDEGALPAEERRMFRFLRA